MPGVTPLLFVYITWAPRPPGFASPFPSRLPSRSQDNHLDPPTLCLFCRVSPTPPALHLLWSCCCSIKTYQSPPSVPVHHPAMPEALNLDVLLVILRLFRTFVDNVIALLEQRAHASEPTLPQPSPRPTFGNYRPPGHVSTSSFAPSPQDTLSLASLTLTQGSEPTEGTPPSTPQPEQPVLTTPEAPGSPSAWRSQRTPNTQLRREFTNSGICPHYCHEVVRPRLLLCPVCRENPPRPH